MKYFKKIKDIQALCTETTETLLWEIKELRNEEIYHVHGSKTQAFKGVNSSFFDI